MAFGNRDSQEKLEGRKDLYPLIHRLIGDG